MANTSELEESETYSEVALKFLERQHLCYENANASSPKNKTGFYCPRVFDGWSCWEETAAGTSAFAPCPDLIIGFDPNRLAHKECLEDGTWFRHPETNATWSNYTTCVDIVDLQWRQQVIAVYETGYFVSVLALVISLLIFCSFRCLECTRVRIHKHLFFSFIVSNVLWLIWYRVVVNDPQVTSDEAHEVWCVPLHILVQYFLVANYFWMFCEGFYLHTLLVFAFTRAESKLLKGFYIFGWLGPILPVGFYAYFRGSDPDERKGCGINDSQWSLFLAVPVCLSLVLSLAFLINILRVLLTKLKDNRRNYSSSIRTETNSPDSQNSLKRAARATLILIPLLGIHYLLTPFRPPHGSQWEIIYEFIAAFSSSLQGLCVSLLFCFCNGEVILVLRRYFCSKYCPGTHGHRGEYSAAPTSMCSYSVTIPNRQNEMATMSEDLL